MSTSISTSGRVCLCEWLGPVTVTMIVSLLSNVRRLRVKEKDALLLLLRVNVAAAKSMCNRNSPFLTILPAFVGSCQEVLIVCDDVDCVESLRHVINDALLASAPSTQRSFGYFELLDDAFVHAQNSFPHEALELRRKQLRSGTWVTVEATKARSTSRLV